LHGNPRFYAGGLDIANILAIGGNGVDLFFVISGFCMYYFYASKSDFSYRDFYRFLFKRWARLSPAFYAATLIYILVNRFCYHNNVNVIMNLLHSIFYLSSIGGQYSTASHFWTLTVEWQFYFTIPFLLIYQNTVGFKKIFSIVFGAILLAAIIYVFIRKGSFDNITATLLFHGVQFGCGVVAARMVLRNIRVLKNRELWLFASVVVIYTGRILISAAVFKLSADYYNLFRLLGFTLMGMGFAGILYLSVTSVKWLDIILGNRVFKSIGRISYSFYLMHVLIFPVVGGFIIHLMPSLKNIAAPMLTTLISAIILYPISLLSYNLLEKPFLSIGNLTTK
jgi:peptidoglycan/LPS O-acetylase OafA/YrhL